jgi:hypothetical protein
MEGTGSKLQALVDVIKHLLKDDRIEDPTFDSETGEANWPTMPPICQDETRPQTRKIIVFQEFTMMEDTMMSVRRAKQWTAVCLTRMIFLGTDGQWNRLHRDQWENRAARACKADR